MGSISRYIFRTAFGAFVLVLVSLTAVIWVTQALRDIDLLTNQGQTILVFIAITAMLIPMLVLIIAPIALVIAVAHVLNKMGTDSEIIVMNGAGMSPWLLFRAFFSVGVVVSIVVALISAYVAPLGLRKLRDRLTEVSADLVTNIVQPGRFTTIEGSLTFHIRERPPNGLLLGVLVDDRRNPQERITILAERGELLENDSGKFLLLQNGSVQRHEATQRDPTFVVFDRYAFDLSRFTGGPQAARYSVRERPIWQLIAPDPNDPAFIAQPGQFHAEFHDRLLAPLYPLVFVVIAYAYLGAPRTTRQSRTVSLIGAVGAVVLLRIIGFASTVVGVGTPVALFVPYIVMGIVSVVGLIVIGKGVIIEPPAFLVNAIAALTERISRRVATT